MLLITTALAICFNAFAVTHDRLDKKIDWQQINWQSKNFLSTLKFPKQFAWGMADSAFQVEGSDMGTGVPCSNNWTMTPGCQAGNACDRWSRYKEDIALMKAAGFSHYRFSFEWSKINPAPGVFDRRIMQHYVDVVDEVIAQGMEPVLMLFHHTWPVWFDELKSFEKSENIKYFVDYACYVFSHLQNKVKIWMTFNEPSGYAIQGYARGAYPPFKKDMTFAKAAKVLKHYLDAHVAVYKAFKAINKSVQIGYTKAVEPLKAYHSWSLPDLAIAAHFDYLMNRADIDYFTKGKFTWHLKDYKSTVKQPLDCLDYIGVNYYSYTKVNLFKPKIAPGDIVSDNNRVIYPEGLLEAIRLCSKFNKPMYIGENGVADAHDKVREMYIKQHLYVVSLALSYGYDIRGYFYWTFMDTFGWTSKYNSKYGLYAVNFETQERTLRPSAVDFIEFVKSQTSKS